MVAKGGGGKPKEAPSAARVAAFKTKPVAYLCEQNGISRDQYVSVAEEDAVRYLEMMHFNLARMEGFGHFPALTELCIVAQDVAELAGLEACTGLEKLWVCETNVSVIEGLSKCTRLRELYLYTNRISCIQGLDTLRELEKLALFENQIDRIQGLSTLTRLQELNLASNRIAAIPETAFVRNRALSTLNLADNRLADLRDIPHLAALPVLMELSFSDPDHGSNPLCTLANYGTQVIFHLNMLLKLDGTNVTSNNLRQVTEATVDRKRMYYHMRLRTLARHRHLLQARLDAIKAPAENALRERLRRLKLEHRECERMLRPVADRRRDFSRTASITGGDGAGAGAAEPASIDDTAPSASTENLQSAVSLCPDPSTPFPLPFPSLLSCFPMRVRG